MNSRIIGALIAKDLVLFFRNRFFAFVTVLGLVAYVVIYLVMPNAVDEELSLALYAPERPPVFELVEEEGLEFEEFDTEEALKSAVAEGDYQAGIVLGEAVMSQIAAGQKAPVRVYLTATAPPEIQEVVPILVEELFHLQAGQPLGIEIEQEIIGQDRVGSQIPPRDRMVPLFAIFLLLVEMLGLASLITEEIVGRTLQALLITPMTVAGLFTAKGILGVGLAAGQAVLFMLLTTGLGPKPLLVILTLLLGAVLVTGLGFLLASLSRDLLTIMGWGVPILVVLIVPAFTALFPGGVSDWVRVIPSYYLVDTVYQVVNLGNGWSAVWGNLAILSVVDAAIVGLGITAMRRKIL